MATRGQGNGSATRAAGEIGAAASAPRSQTIATVERAADVLLHFAQADGPTMGVTEIAQDLSLSKAAVHRILASLRSRGLIHLDEHTRRYSLGPMAMSLGLSYLSRLDVRRIGGAELPALSAKTHETATLSLRIGDTRVYVDQVTPTREVIMSVSIGQPFPLHAGASSKAFLAFLPEAEIEVYLAKQLTALTAATVVDRARLRAELREIRGRGWAQSRGERQLGAASAAAPVLDHERHPVAVVSVCGPAERFVHDMPTSVEQLLAATGRASRQMGYHPPAS